jgi:antitoxin component of RelBE/YafQ-DinJ toxin-antitoxin module
MDEKVDEDKKNKRKWSYKKYADRVQVASYIDKEMRDEIKEIAEKHGLTISGVVSLLLTFGLETFKRSYQPEKLLTPEIWAKIIEGTKQKI